MCTDEDASDLKEDVDTVNGKYDEVKGSVREKVSELDEALRSVTTDVSQLCMWVCVHGCVYVCISLYNSIIFVLYFCIYIPEDNNTYVHKLLRLQEAVLLIIESDQYLST